MWLLCLIVRPSPHISYHDGSRCKKSDGSVELGCRTRMVERPSVIVTIDSRKRLNEYARTKSRESRRVDLLHFAVATATEASKSI